MPLPDERPRQSVANLIGRFEQQNKRQSLNSATAAAIAASPLFVPRPSSVVTHYTGDSAKEESKEKREWPPKLKPVAGSVLHSIDTTKAAESRQSKPTSPTSPLALEPDIIAQAAEGPSSQDAVSISPSPSPPLPPPAPEVVPPTPQVEDPPSPLSPETPPSSAPESTPQSQAPSSPTRTKPSSRVPSTPSKGKVLSTAGRVTKPTTTPKVTRTAAKSPPTSFHAISISSSVSTPASQSLKSSLSAKPGPHAATAKPRPSSSAASTRPTPSTPARPKTPSARPKTPSTARPKTPSSIRPKTPAGAPKTPSSRLFAPTAASLARAGNLPEPPAPPAKKMSLGPGVAERLSKPTASSISKARAPTLVMSPPRGGAAGTKSASTTARGGAAVKRGGVPATRGGLRPKTGVGATVAKAKEQKGATVVQEKVEEVHQDVEEDHHEEEHQIEQEIEQEHQHDPVGSANTTVTLVDTPSQDLVQEPEEHEDLSVFAKDDASSLVDEDLDSVHDFTGEHYEVLSSEDVAPAQVSHELVFEEHDTNGVQDELDDMVNLLETKPLFNSATTFATSEGVMKEVEGKSVEDVVLEIPDEE